MQANAVDMSDVSGPQLHVKAVFDGLQKHGHKVRMVAIQKNRILYSDDLINWCQPVDGFSMTKPFRLVESALRRIQSSLNLPFFRLFDSYRFSDACVTSLQGFDILYERDSTISYGSLIAGRRLGIPTIIEVNGDLIEEWKFLGIKWSRSQWMVVKFLTGYIYRHVSHIVAVGETIRRRLISQWNLEPSQVSVVTNGADIDLFLHVNEESDIRSRFSIGEGQVAIFTGSFQPWHGADLILEAFRQCIAALPELKLVLVGDGPFKAKLEDQVKAFNLDEKVIFTGRVNHADVAQLLFIADIAIIYHRGDAAEIVETPLKLFEYMAAGKAIIAPAVPNMEKILVNKVNALLVPPDQPLVLADTMINLLKDYNLRNELGKMARKEAVDKHSWDRVVSELEVIFHRQIGNG